MTFPFTSIELIVAVLLVTSARCVSSFGISNSLTFHHDYLSYRRLHDTSSARLLTTLGSSTSSKDEQKGDDYDDWYADFDPSEWEDKADNAMSNGRRGRTQGSTGGSHDYVRDTSSDNSNIDVDAVDALLSERLQARKTGQFDVADDIRDDLIQNYGVMVWDREKTWRSGCSKSGSGMRRPSQNRRKPQRVRDFGPLGHDYSESQDAGSSGSSLSDEEIHKRIAERLQCKLSRDFRNADQIQADLADDGVFLHDGRKEWRADGVPFGDHYTGNSPSSKPGRQRGSRTDFGPHGHDYYPAPDAGPITSTLPEDEIHSLIAERLQCKMNRRFAQADSIQAELISNGVFIHDRRKVWRADGEPFADLSERDGREGASRDYSQSEFSESLSPEDTKTVLNLMSLRAAARKKRDYEVADDLQDELREDWNVELDDKRRQWSVGGEFGRSQGPPSKEWVRRGGGDLSDEDVSTITSMLSERTEAKKGRNFDLADSIRDELRETYSLSIDDFSFEWRVLSDEYVPVGSPSLDPDTVSYIQESLARRMEAKQNRDYDVADTIRDELREEYAVLVDDRTREWRVDGPDEGYAANGNQSNVQNEPSDLDIDAELEAILEDDGSSNEQSESEIVDYTSLTVVELKDRLRDAGLPVSGNKADLVDRLTKVY